MDVIRAGQTDPTDLGVLDPLMHDLESSLHLPLQAARVSSGNWLLVCLDQDRLRERAIGHLHGRAGVTDVRPLPQGADDLGHLALAVKFAPQSPEYKALAPGSSAGREIAIPGLLDKLSSSLDLPLTDGRASDGVLRFTIDLEQLTQILVSRLAQAPQIEAANPNYILGAIGGGPS